MEPGHHHEIVKLASEIGYSTAFVGAFSSFFSVWQFCIAQISPFFIAFLIGVYLIEGNGINRKSIVNILIASSGYLIGFSIIFALLGTSSSNIAGYLLYNIKAIRIFSGIFILVVGLLMFTPHHQKAPSVKTGMNVEISPKGVASKPWGLTRGAGFTTGFSKAFSSILPKWMFWLFAPFIGVSFAFIYSPCIPPVLSQILNYASISENASQGFLFLLIYGTGLSVAFITAGVVLSVAVGRLTETVRPYIIAICSLMLMVIGIMAITGLMVHYKAFLLSFFV